MGLTAVTLAAPLAIGALGVLPATVDPDDQAAADAAVAVFNERLAEFGWRSMGPLTQAGPPDEAEQSTFGHCLGGFERYLDYADEHFQGQTAQAFSDDFELVGRDPTASDSVGETAYAGAVVLTAADAGLAMLDTFVEQLGARDTASCISELPTFQSMSDDEATVEANVTNEADLGVGTDSARLDLTVTIVYDTSELTSSATFVAARVDRSLAVVAVGGTGSAHQGLDPIAELAAIADTLAG